MKTWLVCGGRDYKDAKLMFEKLDELHTLEDYKVQQDGSKGPKTIRLRIVHGDAKGADTIADIWARVRGHDFKGYPADWHMFKSNAGKVRNAQMLEEEDVDLVIAFPGGWGTMDMLTKARVADIPTIEVSKDGKILRKP